MAPGWRGWAQEEHIDWKLNDHTYRIHHRYHLPTVLWVEAAVEEHLLACRKIAAGLWEVGLEAEVVQLAKDLEAWGHGR